MYVNYVNMKSDFGIVIRNSKKNGYVDIGLKSHASKPI